MRLRRTRPELDPALPSDAQVPKGTLSTLQKLMNLLFCDPFWAGETISYILISIFPNCHFGKWLGGREMSTLNLSLSTLTPFGPIVVEYI